MKHQYLGERHLWLPVDPAADKVTEVLYILKSLGLRVTARNNQDRDVSYNITIHSDDYSFLEVSAHSPILEEYLLYLAGLPPLFMIERYGKYTYIFVIDGNVKESEVLQKAKVLSIEIPSAVGQFSFGIKNPIKIPALNRATTRLYISTTRYIIPRSIFRITPQCYLAAPSYENEGYDQDVISYIHTSMSFTTYDLNEWATAIKSIHIDPRADLVICVTDKDAVMIYKMKGAILEISAKEFSSTYLCVVDTPDLESQVNSAWQMIRRSKYRNIALYVERKYESVAEACLESMGYNGLKGLFYAVCLYAELIGIKTIIPNPSVRRHKSAIVVEFANGKTIMTTEQAIKNFTQKLRERIPHYSEALDYAAFVRDVIGDKYSVGAVIRTLHKLFMRLLYVPWFMQVYVGYLGTLTDLFQEYTDYSSKVLVDRLILALRKCYQENNEEIIAKNMEEARRKVFFAEEIDGVWAYFKELGLISQKYGRIVWHAVPGALKKSLDHIIRNNLLPYVKKYQDYYAVNIQSTFTKDVVITMLRKLREGSVVVINDEVERLYGMFLTMFGAELRDNRLLMRCGSRLPTFTILEKIIQGQPMVIKHFTGTDLIMFCKFLRLLDIPYRLDERALYVNDLQIVEVWHEDEACKFRAIPSSQIVIEEELEDN